MNNQVNNPVLVSSHSVVTETATAINKICKLNAVTRVMSFGLIIAMNSMLAITNSAWAGEEHGHEDVMQAVESNAAEAELHAEGALKLTSQQRRLAGIKVVQLSNRPFSLDTVATATLAVDRDRTVSLAPQVEVRINARHVVPGQQVAKGQALLTLSGSAVAQAQADFINASAEWSRVKRMSASVVSVSRRMQTEVDAELKRAVLEAMKMTSGQIKALESKPNAIGSFQLLAPIDGRVQQDNAMLGRVVEAGTNLLQLTDESHLWVEAQLTPNQAKSINIGSTAMVRVGDKALEGTIIGRSQEIDRQTRTESVLVRMANPGHELHAGQFAELYLPMNTDGKGGVIVPDAALTRSGDGDWQVFIEDEDGFEAVEVEVLDRQRGMNLVKGVEANARVVISGAFFLASEQAKSGFDIHGH